MQLPATALVAGLYAELRALSRQKVSDLLEASPLPPRAGEEAAIRAVEPAVENLYAPRGGEAVIVLTKGGASHAD